MSRSAFALKYRPQTFDDVVGQATTVRILKNILQEKRIHPACLFSGPRGIGKTSLARIFAKSLNCQQGPTETPCGACVSCVEITEGRSLSVMEIDGASNTSVDDVRDLREKIRYLPPGGRYKIYIIDEVHMLSTAAFNALLKTLEEPPLHALFIFATTELQKVPITILSRCLRFDLKPITVGLMVERLRQIAQRESIEVEENALFAIARESSGGLRDAIGLLDQAASFSSSKVTLQAVEEILGGSIRRLIPQLASSILGRNPQAIVSTLNQTAVGGVDPKRVAVQLLEYFRHLLVIRVSESPDLFDLPPDDLRQLKELAQTVSESSLDQMFRMLQQGIPDLLRSPSPRVLLDVLCLRLGHYQELQSLEAILQHLESIGPAPAQRSLEMTPPAASFPIAARPEKNWTEFLQTLKMKKPQIASILEHSVGSELKEGEVVVSFATGSIHMEMLKERERQLQLEALVVSFFGRPLKVKLEETAAASNLVEEAIAIFQPRSLKTNP